MTAKNPRMLNIEFLVLLIVMLFFNVPYCADSFIPVHDTMFNAQAFHVFYREWFFHGQLPHWIPYGTYGWTSTMEQLAFLSPMSYVVALTGRLLHVTDTLLLFKSSVILEQLVLLLGMYLLSRRLFSNRSTVLLVCLGTVGSTVWYAQVHLNFRIFYLFPLVMYFLFRFFETHRPAWLWVAGMTTVAWAMGNVPYVVALWVLTLSIIVLVLFGADRTSWRTLLARSRDNLLPLILFIALTAVYLYQVAQAVDLTFLSGGRNETTGAVGIQPFLSHGGRAESGAVMKSLVFGWPLHLPWGSARDNSVYVGLLCVACVLWAVLRVRTVWFLALAGALVALVWLSFGGFFATAAYYAVPTMDHYRHVGLVYGLAKILFLLCVGFGWEHFWSARNRVRTVLVMLIIMGVLVDALHVVFPFDFYPLHAWRRLASEEAWPAIFLWRVGLYGLLTGVGSLTGRALVTLLRRTRARFIVPLRVPGVALRTALIVGLVLDLVLYQAVVYAEAPKLPPAYAAYLDAMTVADWQFQSQRTTKPIEVRQQHAMSLIAHPGAMASYALAYSFAQFDPCATAFRGDWWSARVVALLRATSEGDWWDARGDVTARLVGCDSPKLRLVPHAVSAASDEETLALIRTMPDLERVSESMGTVRVTRFTANDLMIEADVASNTGAWLVYADAFHPGWQAAVNGRRVPIAEAYLAFKAVWLDAGHSVVHLTFRRGVSGFFSYVMAFFGTCAGLVLLAACWRALWSVPQPVARR